MNRPAILRVTSCLLVVLSAGMARAEEWDHLGLRYRAIAALGTPGNTPLPQGVIAGADGEWLLRWLAWQEKNQEILRNLHSILGEPALGKVTATAGFQNERGFVFLLNPNFRPLRAEFRLDASIGLADGQRYQLRQLYPDVEKDKLFASPSGT